MAEVVLVVNAPSRELSDEVSKVMGSDMPAGLIVHTATEVEGGQIRIIDVWESREATDAFGERMITPAMTKIMGDAVAEAPALDFLEPFEVRRPS